jgi:iron-sulfur cluster assembly protein
MPITLTERAAQEVKAIVEQQKLSLEDTYLRVGVKGGGCSGFTYSLDLTDVKNEQDETFDSFGITIVCDMKSYLYINGTSVDFKDELMGRGFVFNNPNATDSCGCGSSFSA